ncbi:MAG: septum formation inhibitor Maf [Candidatus Levybacteria bacterium]|nr:septum formation inhibitor Maf [Candidatus Levybacteria bacterium]
MKKIVLASGSPRRKLILQQIGLKFEVLVSNQKEKVDPRLTPAELAEKLSLQKAKAVAPKYKNAIIIAADTIVVFKGKILGKPKTEENAKKMLKTLSGEAHFVITGFTIIDSDSKKSITKSVKTKVYIKKLSSEEIESYVATKEPLDKAGAYGINELGGVIVEKIEGDFYNVVGLPLFTVVEQLKKFGVEVVIQ